ncbi:MAG TPA: response regulator transcription factor, partial [Sulfurihydrogenibium azorense]|nr:response regulator transcription factor [Sulfurihydrogenibium azorense]
MKILVVEDEKRLGKLIKKGLEEENYLVDLVYDGEEALNYLSTQNYDVVILDLMIPKLDGKEVIKILRAKNVKVPIIILTAKDEIKSKIEALDLGADDYITKPFNFEELLARIRAVLRRDKDIKSS